MVELRWTKLFKEELKKKTYIQIYLGEYIDINRQKIRYLKNIILNSRPPVS